MSLGRVVAMWRYGKKSRCGVGLLQAGFTLVELLLSLTLAAMLVLVVGRFFLANYEVYQFNQALAQNQTAARIVMSLLNREIHKTGYLGCVSGLDHIRYHHHSERAVLEPSDFITIIHGDDLSAHLAVPETIIDKAKANSDILQLRVVDQTGWYLQSDMSLQRRLILQPGPEIDLGDTLWISDCEDLTQFDVESRYVTDGVMTVVAKENFSKHYAQYSQVMRLETIYFYVADTGRARLNGEPIYGFYRQSEQGIAEEIVEGVSEFKMAQYEPSTGAISVADDVCLDKVNCLLEIRFVTRSVQPVFGQPTFASDESTQSDLLTRRWRVLVGAPNIR